MKRLASICGAFCLITMAVGVAAQDKPAPVDQASPPVLSDVQKLKADLFAAKVQIAQLKAALADRDNKLASYELTKEQGDLATEFLKQMNAEPGSTWDWQTMTAKAPEKLAEKMPPASAPTSPKK